MGGRPACLCAQRGGPVRLSLVAQAMLIPPVKPLLASADDTIVMGTPGPEGGSKALAQALAELGVGGDGNAPRTDSFQMETVLVLRSQPV